MAKGPREYPMTPAEAFLREHGDRMTNHPRIAPLAALPTLSPWYESAVLDVLEVYPTGEWPTPRVVSGRGTWFSMTTVPVPLWRRLVAGWWWRELVIAARYRLADWIEP